MYLEVNTMMHVSAGLWLHTTWKRTRRHFVR